jgi:polysaccharide export outer membrane protein
MGLAVGHHMVGRQCNSRGGGKRRALQTGEAHSTGVPANPSDAGRGTPRWVVSLILIVFALLPMPALADYVVQRGDVLEVSVVGLPGLQHRALVDAGGQIVLPLLGDIDAAGKSLANLRAALRQLLKERNIVRDPEVTIDVAEYRPVYVGGDVEKPGAYPYRPGMTVRDAVALAQGYDVLHLRGRDPLVEAANARGDYDAFAVDFAKEVIRVTRLKAEIAGTPHLDETNFGSLPVRPEVLSEITQLQNQQLAADLADGECEKSYLKQMIKGTADQIAVLQQEQQGNAAAAAEQNKNLQRARALMQQGLLQNARLEEVERNAEVAQSQLFQVQARLAQAQKDLTNFSRQLQSADDQRRIRLLQEERDAVTQAATARARFQAAADRVRFAGALETGGQPAVPREPPDVTIYRSVSDAQQRIAANEGSVLNPGDNVGIVIRGPAPGSVAQGQPPIYLPSRASLPAAKRTAEGVK